MVISSARVRTSHTVGTPIVRGDGSSNHHAMTHTYDARWIGHYDEDGWLEIREAENPDAWLATDRPVDIES